jgi:hypothetical protein
LQQRQKSAVFGVRDRSDPWIFGVVRGSIGSGWFFGKNWLKIFQSDSFFAGRKSEKPNPLF